MTGQACKHAGCTLHACICESGQSCGRIPVNMSQTGAADCACALRSSPSISTPRAPNLAASAPTLLA